MGFRGLLPRLLLWATTAAGAGATFSLGLAWLLRPSVVPDDVDSIRLVCVASPMPHRLPVEFRLENAGRRPALVAPHANSEGVGFDLTILGPDGAPVPLPRGLCCGPLLCGVPPYETLQPGERSSALERSHPLRGWSPGRPGRYRFLATYRYAPFDTRWQGLPVLGRWSEVDSSEDALRIRRTRAFTRTLDFEIDLP